MIHANTNPKYNAHMLNPSPHTNYVITNIYTFNKLKTIFTSTYKVLKQLEYCFAKIFKN